ncbi:MAG: family 10 glycosylhydrolase [Acholeplasmataceae bacterium]|jgi:uncharacterized lipoprotein YddW (UPF0748 family)|nr:family 10 glycosylhydrolase [Acholeplasmataceae bacterium]
MRTFIKKFLIVLVSLIFITLGSVNIKAATTTKTIKINGAGLDVIIDPISFNTNGLTLENITGKAVLYTPDWPYLKPNRDEVSVEYVAVKNASGNYIIQSKNSTKDNKIPLNGVILSIPKILTFNYNVGDTISPNGVAIKTYEHAFSSNKGVRIGIDLVNGPSKYNEITYYNRLYGSRTATNKFNTNEIIVTYDNNSNRFKVTGVGKSGNNDIPSAGFVVAANSSPKMHMFNNGVLFNEGDIIELINLEYMKLGDVITRNFTCINGTRFADYLVIYPASSNPTLSSQQNVYGIEVAVNSDGVVIDKDILVQIPEGGFIASGHGTAHTFIEENIHLGSIVTYNATAKTITVSNHLIDQTLYNYQYEANIAQDLVYTARDEMYDVNNLSRALENLATILDGVTTMEGLKTKIYNTQNPVDIGEFLDIKDEIEPLFEQIFFDTLVSRRIESRGTWHRPYETNLTLIQSTLNELKSMNFTDVYLETFWNGYTIYKSELAPYHTIFDGATFGEYEDYMDAFVNEAKKRDINVHAWVENFFVGAHWKASPLWDRYPEWRLIDINGGQFITGKPGGEEEGFIFFDPAHPDARQFIKDIYKEIIDRGVVGLHLDYIRYPSGNQNVSYSTGYTEYAMNEFKQLYNETGDIRKRIKNGDDALYGKWNQYRLSKIDSFVEELHNEIRAIDSSIVFSMAVGPNAAYAKENLLQDWKKWVENGWIDSVEPMVYVNGVSVVTSTVSAAKTIMAKYAYMMPGIAPTYDGLPAIYNATYTDAINKNGAHGSTIFATHNYRNKPELHAIFQNGTYKNKAVSIQDPMDEVLAMFITDILYKFDNIYIKKGVSTTEKRNALETRLNDLTKKHYYNPIDYYELYEALDHLTLELMMYAEGAAVERFMEDIEYFMEIIDIRISRYLINNGHWDLTEEPERPSVYAFEYPKYEGPPNDDDPGSDPIIEPDPEPRKKWPIVLIGSLIGVGVLVSVAFIIRKKIIKPKNKEEK